MASFIGNFTKKTIAAVFQDNFTNSLRTVLLEKASKRLLLKIHHLLCIWKSNVNFLFKTNATLIVVKYMVLLL